MIEKPIFTVVTVVFNGERYIEDTIKSIIENKKKFNNIEYIIIDGMSTDKTIEIIKKYENYIDYWISEKDQGIYDAMNKGIKKANGSYISFLNADDWYEDETLSYIYEHLNDTDMYPDFIFGNFNLCQEDKTKLYTYIPNLKKLNKKMTIGHPSLFVRADIQKKYLFDLQFPVCADYDLVLKLVNNFENFLYLNKSITNFRLVGVSTQTNVGMEVFKVQKKHFNYVIALKNFFINQFEYNLFRFIENILGKKKFDKLKSQLRGAK